MASGLKIVLPLSFTDTSLPILRDDPVLPDAGALLLLEPAHDIEPWAAGVPASGARLPNLVWKQAAAAVGGGATEDTLKAQLTRSAGFAAAVGTLERTAKGGLHGISSQLNGVAATGAALELPGSHPIKAHIAAHPTHEFYMSLWLRPTRLPAGGISDIFEKWAGDGTRANYFLTGATPGFSNFPTAPDQRLGSTSQTSTVPAAAGTPAIVNSRTTGFNGTVPSAAAMLLKPAIWGPGPAGENTSGLNKAGSFVFYRCYLEDLTVSGRTYATVDDLDVTEFTKQLLAPGGRYYGDTYSAPTTVAP